MAKTLKQLHYGNLEIDAREKDVIQIINKDDLIFIERENLPEFIELLKAELEVVNG